MKLLVVRYGRQLGSDDPEQARGFLEAAEKIAGLPGLVWKLWAYDDAEHVAESFLFMHRVIELARAGDSYNVSLSDGRTIEAGAVIVATGASYRRLAIPSLEALEGAGVFYGGASSEAPGLPGKDVYVVGGGNAAGQAALHLARYARKVTLAVRARSLGAGMSQYLVRAVEAAPSIEVRTGTAVVGGGGGRPARADPPRPRRNPDNGRSRRAVRDDRRPAADRVAAGGDRAGRARLPVHRRRSRPRELAARAPAALARDEPAGHPRRRRRPPRLGQARRRRGGRGRDERAARSAAARHRAGARPA